MSIYFFQFKSYFYRYFSWLLWNIYFALRGTFLVLQCIYHYSLVYVVISNQFFITRLTLHLFGYRGCSCLFVVSVVYKYLHIIATYKQYWPKLSNEEWNIQLQYSHIYTEITITLNSNLFHAYRITCPDIYDISEFLYRKQSFSFKRIGIRKSNLGISHPRLRVLTNDLKEIIFNEHMLRGHISVRTASHKIKGK